MRLKALLVGLALVLIYEGCGNIRLSAIIREDFSSMQAMVDTEIPQPKVAPGQRRIIFFIDQSFSMIRSGCPQDLDANPEDQIRTDGNVNSCSYAAGSDATADRLSVVRKWLAELEEDVEGNVDAPGTKVALVPFSGGKFGRPMWGVDQPTDFQFLTLRQAKARLEILQQEHDTDLNRARQGNDPTRMGTSVPFPTMEYMKSVLMTEIQNLRTADVDLLKATPIQFIYLSDGVYKPLTEYIAKAQRISGCTNSGRYNFCMGDIAREFRRAFGNPEDNDTDKIADLLNEMSTYDRVHGTGPVKIDLISLHPSRVPASDFDSPRTLGHKNIFDAIVAKVPTAKKYILESDALPMSLHMSGASLSYRIEDFYVVNLNAFVSATGDLVADSDGDGLSDDQERQLGTNPTEYQTGGGICNDTIQSFYGCRAFGCDKDWDEDGDGLNECEEKSFDSDVKNGDSDGDNILDIFEVTRRLNPRMSEAGRFTSGTTYSDRQMFFRGVSNRWFLEKTPAHSQVLITRRELDPIKKMGSNGRQYLSRKYQIRLDHLPIVKTLAAHGARSLKRNKTDSEFIGSAVSLVPNDHAADENQIVFLTKIVAEENPEMVFWFMSRKTVKFSSGDIVTMDIDLTNFVQLDLGKKFSTP